MSSYDSDSENDRFLDWLSEEGFEKIYGGYYVCPGDHVWWEDDVIKLYNESLNKGN